MEQLADTIVPKELSWLSFNARVLQEAADPSVPLIERVRFLGIYSSNLDEFFKVRVAELKRQVIINKAQGQSTLWLPDANLHLFLKNFARPQKISRGSICKIILKLPEQRGLGCWRSGLHSGECLLNYEQIVLQNGIWI